MIDLLEGYSIAQLKTAYMAECILRAEPLTGHVNTKFSFGEPSVDMETTTIKHNHGRYSWTSSVTTMDFKLPVDWYDRVYLGGVGKVTYHGKTTLVLDAHEQPIEMLREDLRLDGFKVWKAKLPVHKRIPYGSKTPWGYQPTREKWFTEERYMVSCDIGNETSSICFAAKHVNAAGANLKKSLMAQMQQIMGV